MSRLVRLFSLLMLSTALIPLAAAGVQPAPAPASRFAEYGQPGAFLLQREGAPVQTVHGASWAAQPRRPASTFKVMLALIALETGALRDADEIVPWDGTPYPGRPEWQKDMALREAIQTSSEFYFGVLAKRIGHDRLASWVTRVDYGNGRIGPRPERTWHDGVLTVTAAQQLSFIDRLRRGALPFSQANIASVKMAMRDSDNANRRIYGKTGTHLNDDGTGNAWWIGWVEGGKTPAASFVLSIDLKTMDKRAARIALGKQLLRDNGVLPGK